MLHDCIDGSANPQKGGWPFSKNRWDTKKGGTI